MFMKIDKSEKNDLLPFMKIMQQVRDRPFLQLLQQGWDGGNVLIWISNIYRRVLNESEN